VPLCNIIPPGQRRADRTEVPDRSSEPGVGDAVIYKYSPETQNHCYSTSNLNADYSHGIRLVQEVVQLNGSPATVSAILQDDALASILSDERPISISRCGDPLTGMEAERGATPEGSRIFQNFPNPFNPTTDIGFRIPDVGLVRLVVHDLLGREVVVLVNERRGVTRHGSMLQVWQAESICTG
jgi:hypothetical protein